MKNLFTKEMSFILVFSVAVQGCSRNVESDASHTRALVPLSDADIKTSASTFATPLHDNLLSVAMRAESLQVARVGTLDEKRREIERGNDLILELLSCLEGKFASGVGLLSNQSIDDYPSMYTLLRYRGEILASEENTSLAVLAFIDYGDFAAIMGSCGSVLKHLKGWAHLAEANRQIAAIAMHADLETVSTALQCITKTQISIKSAKDVIYGELAIEKTQSLPANTKESAKRLDLVLQRCKTWLALSRCALAVRIYEIDHDGLPDKLNDIVTILNELPVDAYTAAPLIYAKKNGGYLLYSVGANGGDDSRHSGNISGDDLGVFLNYEN